MQVKKVESQAYLPAESCTKFASNWARKFISLHTYKRKGEKKTLMVEGEFWVVEWSWAAWRDLGAVGQSLAPSEIPVSAQPPPSSKLGL